MSQDYSQIAQKAIGHIRIPFEVLSRELVPAGPWLTRAQNWCRALDHLGSDCLYLALAEMRSAVLLTQEPAVRIFRSPDIDRQLADFAAPRRGGHHEEARDTLVRSGARRP
ncbi:MAG: hypothetical protein ACK46L_04920 [Synechococcaceae cyanobacterium]